MGGPFLCFPVRLCGEGWGLQEMLPEGSGAAAPQRKASILRGPESQLLALT